jgi:1-acyl-sn-glycerol-3-phosphate acyltransferase
VTARNDRPEAEEAGTRKAGASKTSAGKASRRKATAGKSRTSKTAASKTAARKAVPGEAVAKRQSTEVAKSEEAAVRPVPASRNAFAAGAARASGERRRRSGTPLLSALEPVELSAARREVTAAKLAVPGQPRSGADETSGAGIVDASSTTTPETPKRKRPPRKAIRERREQREQERALRPVPSLPEPLEEVAAPATEPAQRHTDPAGERPGGAAGIASGLQSRAGRLVGAVLDAAEFSSEVRPGPAELVELAVNVLRAAATAAGVPAEDVERQIAETLAYVRRRLTGDYTVDEFGFDEEYTVHVHLPLLRPLYKSWFRVEVKGIENIPSEGGALVVANHSGTVAMDSLMTQVAVYDEHPNRRHLRMLGADLIFQTPFVGAIARRSGTTLAANTDAERLLSDGHLVGVWPEGFKGVGKPFSERYKLQRFGRGGFVSAALRAGVPIVPCSIVGAEEIYPMIGNLPTLARLLGVPYVPITPTFPWLGPLGAIPLPSKWLIEFGPPIETTSYGPETADDPMLVFDLTDQVRETIQQTLYSLLMQRRSVFI